MKHLIKLTLLSLVLSTICGCGTTPEDSPELTPTATATKAPTATPSPTTPPTETPVPTKEPAPTKESTRFSYPTMHADIPDLDIIRVGETYYMVSTTMNLCPGAPIMKSTDLGHWEIVNYVYDTFADDDVTNLENGRDMYAHGSWAASLKYNEADGLYYVAFNSNDHGFFIYTTSDIENGTWTKHACRGGYHDPALFFENGNLYVISAAGGNCSIQQLSLDSENGTVTTVGSSKRLFSASKDWGLWEGAHAYKVGDYYYIFIIASPSDRWMRTEVCYRSKDLFSTDWEEQIVY
ncbi:MAG: glycoside hydrolase 43 family protein, partial [Lachnospiraceae bacterium]|nr:glycoside hydrolase 43 family protein [Lachnospiraceae bacterium]